MRLTSVLKTTLALSLASLAVLWVAAIVFDAISMRAEAILATVFLIAVTSLAALPCATCLERARHRRLMLSGLIASIGAGAGWIAYVWLARRLPFGGDALANMLMPVTVWAGFCMLFALLATRRITGIIPRGLRFLTLAVGGVLGLAILWIAWFDVHRWLREDEVVQLISGLSVIVAFGAFTTMVASRLRQLEGDEEADTDDEVRLPLTLTCPRCGRWQETQTGGANCIQCGLHIRIMVP